MIVLSEDPDTILVLSGVIATELTCSYPISIIGKPNNYSWKKALFQFNLRADETRPELYVLQYSRVQFKKL